MFREDARRKIEHELTKGAAARAEGFEGRARVCARRAAGEAVREYMALTSQQAAGSSAYDLLASLRDLPEIPDELRQAASRLLSKVDEAFQLPEGVDLLADAVWLSDALEGLLQDEGH
jgi:hypothetical protein